MLRRFLVSVALILVTAIAVFNTSPAEAVPFKVTFFDDEVVVGTGTGETAAGTGSGVAITSFTATFDGFVNPFNVLAVVPISTVTIAGGFVISVELLSVGSITNLLVIPDGGSGLTGSFGITGPGAFSGTFSIPEPGTLSLMATGLLFLLGYVAYRRRGRKPSLAAA